MKKLLLKNARIVSSDGIDEKDVVVSAGEILKVCEIGEGEDVLANITSAETGEKAEIIDLAEEGLYLLPGLIDTHVHFREPGFEEKGNFASESEAALKGGITTIFDMPNTDPPTTTYEAFAEKVRIAEENCKCNFKLYMGAVSAKDTAEIGKVLDDKRLSRFLAGVKVFMGCSTGCLLGGHEALESILADEKLRFIDDLNEGGSRRFLPIVVHAEDERCLVMNAARVDSRKPSDHSKARPIECAVISVKEVCHLARKYMRPVHMAHVTSKEELDVIEKFKGDCVDGCGLDRSVAGGAVPLVTCEVSPHHLFLNDSLYEKLGWFLKVNPPVRSKGDVGRLWQALYDGQVDIIASDHSPHALEDKSELRVVAGGEVGDVSAGMPEVQTTLPLLLNEVVSENLSLEDVVRLTAEKPAEIFGLSKAGKIESGFNADLVVVDMKVEKIVRASDMAYKCGWTCYEGRKLRGWPKMVILGGERV